MEAIMDVGKQTAARTKIIAAVLHYQNNHRGLSPTDEMIAIESGVSRDVVRSQLREMEKEGFLTDSKRWPRMIKINRADAIDKLMDVVDPRQQPPANDTTSQVVRPDERRDLIANIAARQRSQKGGSKRWAGVSQEDRSAHMKAMAEKRWGKKEEDKMRKRPKPFMDAAKSIAKAIIELSHEYKRAPYISEIAKACGYTSETGAHRVMMMMRDEGWIGDPAKRYGDWRLTDNGIEALFGKMIDTPVVEPQPETDKHRAFYNRMAFFERAKQVAAVIDEFTDAHGIPPSGEDIRLRIGVKYAGTLSNTSKRMVEEGWLDHKSGHHRDYRLTNLGRTSLLHSAPVEREVMGAEPVAMHWKMKADEPVKVEVTAQPEPEPRVARRDPFGGATVTIRTLAPDEAPRPAEQVERYVAIPDLSKIDSLDMALELQRRGWKVSR